MMPQRPAQGTPRADVPYAGRLLTTSRATQPRHAARQRCWYNAQPGTTLANVVRETRAALSFPFVLLEVLQHLEEHLVTFSAEDPEPRLRAGVWRLELGRPTWQALDRGSVEALLGVPLER